MELLDFCLGGVLFLFEVLVAPEGGAEIDREFLIHNCGESVGMLCCGIEKGDLIRGEGWTVIVHGDRFEMMVMDWVTFTIGSLNFSVFVLNGKRDVGGDDDLIGGWIRDLDAIEIGGEHII